MPTTVIGPNRPITDPAQLNWSKLPRGTTIQLEGKGTPYSSKLFISTDDLTLECVPGPKGDTPVIDGTNATESRTNDYLHGWYIDRLSGKVMSGQGNQCLIFIGCSKTKGYGKPPINVTIKGNLTLQNWYLGDPLKPKMYIDESGKVLPIGLNAAGIHIEQATGCFISGIKIDNVNAGMTSKGECPPQLGSDYIFDDITLTNYGTALRAPGMDRRDRDHGTYISAQRVEYRNMKYGPPRPGSLGALLKDRSAGTYIHNCDFDGRANGVRIWDLVDTEEGGACFPFFPEYVLTRVEDNVVYANCAGYPIHCGSDGKGHPRPVLHFQRNRYYFQMNQRPTAGEPGSYNFDLVKLDFGPTKVILENETVVMTAGVSKVCPDMHLAYSEYKDAGSSVEIRGTMVYQSPKPFLPSRSGTVVIGTVPAPGSGGVIPPPVVTPPTSVPTPAPTPTPSGTLNAPTGLTVTVTGKQVKLMWVNNEPSATQIRVYRSDKSSQIGTFMNNNTTVFYDQSVPSGSYTYRIQARSATTAVYSTAITVIVP